MNLYYNELSKNTDNKGNLIIFNKDEFGRTFLDYVVEYKSFNAIKYLYDKYQLKLKRYDNFFQVNGEYFIDINFCNSILFARMVAELNDTKLFYDIYNTYDIIDGVNLVYQQDDFLKIILDNDNLFNEMFKTKEYLFEYSNYEKRLYKIDSFPINTINPIINNCLKCAINNIDKYKKQAIKMLNFALVYNKDVIKKLDKNCYFYSMTNSGVLHRGHEIIDLLIYSNEQVTDDSIQKLIDKLPKCENGCFNLYKYENMNS